jgi:peroxiredoxin
MTKHLFTTAFAMALGLALTACTSSDTNSTKSTTSTGTTSMSSSTAKADMKTENTFTTSAPKMATLGMTAPDFTLTDMNGKAVKLSDFRGKTVVLEWFNPGCPYVVYAYGDGKLGEKQKSTMKNDVVWLSINSGAPGMQGTGMDTNKKAYDDWKMSSKLLFDESGTVGQAYGAKTTPHCYIVDKKGMLVYRGGLDNAPLGKVKGSSYQNYVEMALADLSAGRAVATSETDPSGCSVKYAK